VTPGECPSREICPACGKPRATAHPLECPGCDQLCWSRNGDSCAAAHGDWPALLVAERERAVRAEAERDLFDATRKALGDALRAGNIRDDTKMRIIRDIVQLGGLLAVGDMSSVRKLLHGLYHNVAMLGIHVPEASQAFANADVIPLSMDGALSAFSPAEAAKWAAFKAWLDRYEAESALVFGGDRDANALDDARTYNLRMHLVRTVRGALKEFAEAGERKPT